VRIEKAGRQRTLLFDTGVSPGGMVENMRRLGIAPGNVEVIVLSHGHCDHVTGMEGLVRALGRTHLPVMIHPEFWNRRRVRFPGLEPAELPSTSRSALDEMGFAIVEERQPSFLLDGARQEWRSTVTPVTSSLVSAKTTTRRAAPRECRNHMRAALSTIGGKSAAPAWKDASPPSRRLLLRWTREAAAGRP
jgi:Metallo-beta-lactamase superfamily